MVFHGASIFSFQANSVNVAIIWQGAIVVIFVFFCLESIFEPNSVLQKDFITIIVLGLLFADLVGLFTGLLRSNIPRYLIGDTVNHAIIPVVYLTSYKYFAFQQDKGKKLIISILWVVGACYMIAVLVNDDLTIHPPIVLMAFAVTYLFGSEHRNITIFFLGLCVLVYLMIIVVGSRTPFIQFLAMIFCSFLFFLKNGSSRDRRKVILVMSIFLSIILPITLALNKKPGVHRILEKTSLVSKQKDLSTYNRFLEVHDVLSTLYSEGKTSVLTGLGNGALWTRDKALTRSSNEVYEDELHHIHILPASVFFRQGILGLAIWVALYVTIGIVFCRDFLYNPSKKCELYYLGSMLFVVASVLGTLVKFQMIYNPLIGFFLAYLSISRNEMKLEKLKYRHVNS
jgi:hypothetical protein